MAVKMERKNVGHWHCVGEAHGSDTPSDSGVVVFDAENVKHSVFAGWFPEGHPARKTSHQTPVELSRRQPTNPGLQYLENGRCVCVCAFLNVYEH